jgi:L-asparaginase
MRPRILQLSFVLVAALSLGASSLAPAPAIRQSEASPLPRLKLIATGGTISNRDGSRLSASELVALVPDLEEYATVQAEQFSNLASGQLTLDQWLQLSRRINDAFARDTGLAGIVVTSGTDTLEETAYFLHLTVRSDRPVVVVGSMRRPSTVGYEGAANLLAAFRVAAAPESRGKGVLVVMNEEINSAREVTKSDAVHLEAFTSRGYGLLGTVDRDRVSFVRAPLQRHTSRTEFDVAGVQKLPRVDIVMVYQDASGDLIRAAVDKGAEGLVIASAGAAAVSGTQSSGIRYALDKHCFVVMSTRSGSGRVAPRNRSNGNDGDGDEEAGQESFRIFANDLAPVKARILLMLALTKTRNPAEIQRMFGEY